MVRGGHDHRIASWNIPHGSTEGTAQRTLNWLITPGGWLDYTRNIADTGNVYQGSLEATHVTRYHFWYKCWCTNYAAGVQLFLPHAWALAIVPYYDNASSGDPANFTPTVIPYLFYRSWGIQQELPVFGAEDIPVAVPLQRVRIIHRAYTLLDATDLAFGQAGRVFTAKVTIRKPFSLPHTHGLALITNTYNTHLSTDIDLGAQFASTFGYIHRRTWG